MSESIKKYIIIITGFYIIWLGILPFVLSKAVSILCTNLSHNSNYEIEVVNPDIKLSLIPIIRFRADSVKFKNKYTEDMLKTDNFYAKIRLLPLLSGKIHVNKFSTENLVLSKNLPASTVLNKNFFENLKKTNFIIDEVNLNSYKMIFTAENQENPVVYEGTVLNYRKNNKFLGLDIDSKLSVGKISSKIFINLYIPKINNMDKTKFNIDISDIDIRPIGDFFKNFLPEPIERLEGSVNISANKDNLVTNLNSVKIEYKNKDNSIVFPKLTTVKSDFRINKDCIILNNAELNADNIHLIIKGTLRDYMGKTVPTTDLRIIINKSRVEDFVNALPPFKVEEFDCYKLKKYKFYGDVIGNLSVTGRFPEPNLSGNVYVDNGILIKPIPNTNKGATIRLSFTGRHVSYNIDVPAGGAQKVWVNGTQELYNVKYADLTVKSTSNVDLHTAEEVVNPLHEILNFVIGPVPILDIYGTGNIDLSVKGNRLIPHAWGTLNFYNTNVNFIEIPDLKLKNADAVLTFNDMNAAFKTNKGQVNGKDFNIAGTCNLNGNFDFDVISENQPTFDLYRAIQTSTMINDVKNMIPKLDNILGLSDLKLKIYGSVKEIEDLKFNKNAFAKGIISLKNNDISVQGVHITQTNADIKVDGISASTIIKAKIDNSPLDISAKIKNNIVELTASIPKFNLNSIIKNEFTEEKQNYLPYVSINAKYKGDINNIEYDKLNFDAFVFPQSFEEYFCFNSGIISLYNNKMTIKNLDLKIKDKNNSIKADMQIYNPFSNSPIPNGLLKIKLSDIKLINEIFGKKILPQRLNNYIKDYEFKEGAVNLNARFNDGKLSTESNLEGIKFNYIPSDISVEVVNGKLIVKNNNLRMQTINLLADKMPILVDGEIKDISNAQNFNIYLNSKPKQDFIDKVLNKNTIYPLKIKGDIVFNAVLRGTLKDYSLASKINLAKDASIYYYGATVGDVENAIILDLDSYIRNNKEIRIKEFLYDKVINAQSGKQTRLNMLKVKGGINIDKDGIEFKDLLVRTSNPTDVRIFNIIFGKPNIKQGQFTSNLKMKGSLSNPHILGDFHIIETNIPFLDTTIKNIEFLFRDKIIEIYSKGEVFGNDVIAEAVIKNKLTKPYYIEKASLTTNDMNLNRIVDKLKSVEAENIQPQENIGNFDIESLIVKELKLKAQNIVLRNIYATNFEAETSLNENKLFEMKHFKFNIAQGLLDGKYSYNLKDGNIKLTMNADSISANDITVALFDLRNQIYGDLTGKINLSCDGNNFEKCMQTLNGSTTFNVKNGRMPKLGSLEYLLKAGNLVKGGITSLSINSVIDLITPMKTGEFSDIYGSISIKDGIADNIEITTQGKDLSLFISGTYNFSDSTADMEVLGLLSRKISTMLGPIGNFSVNTLFNLIPGIDLSKDSNLLDGINKIPGIEISGKAYRKFLAVIQGNINEDGYVKSFKWIN